MHVLFHVLMAIGKSIFYIGGKCRFHVRFMWYFDGHWEQHFILKGKRNAGLSFFLLILTIYYGVYYSHTFLQIVLWMWTAGIRVFGRCAIYPVCEIIQPCTTQCIARTIRKAKISCKTSMFKPSAQDFLTPFGTLQRYTTLFDSFTDISFHFYATLNFFSIMVRLTDVQRGRAIALLMQGQSQQQVANHFGVNVSTIERLVRRLRETGHLADRPRSGRPRVTSRRQDRTIRLAHLRNRHLTATETALNTVGTHNRQISPKTVGSRLREIGLRARRSYVGLPLT